MKPFSQELEEAIDGEEPPATQRFPRNTFKGVSKKDMREVRIIAKFLRDANFQGVKGFFRGGGKIDDISARVPVEKRRIGHLLRKYIDVFARAVGKTKGRYDTGKYIPSGRGAFGRLSGGPRGYSQKPSVVFESELEYFGGIGGGPSVPNPKGEKPWPEEYRQWRETGDKEPAPLVLGASVVVRTKDGVAVAEGHIEDIMYETRIIRVRDNSSGADIQVDVDPDRYDVWIMDPEVVGDAPNPAPARTRIGPRRGTVGYRHGS